MVGCEFQSLFHMKTIALRDFLVTFKTGLLSRGLGRDQLRQCYIPTQCKVTYLQPIVHNIILKYLHTSFCIEGKY